jgi:hypothetical protein
MKTRRSRRQQRSSRDGDPCSKLTFQLDADGLFEDCDQRGIDILQSLRLKVTPPIRFNDPFEFMPKVAFVITPEKITSGLLNSSFAALAEAVESPAAIIPISPAMV